MRLPIVAHGSRESNECPLVLEGGGQGGGHGLGSCCRSAEGPRRTNDNLFYDLMGVCDECL